MRAFSGLEVRPYCQTADMPCVRIDRVRVVAYKTVFGEVEFVLMGRMGAMGAEWPVGRPKASFDEAWAELKGVEQQIEQARREEASRVPSPAGAV